MQGDNCPINGITCVSISRVEALERALELEKESRSTAHEKLDNRVRELERDMAVVNVQYKNINAQLTGISSDLSEIKNRPAKRWETVIVTIITAVVSGGVGFLAAVLTNVPS